MSLRSRGPTALAALLLLLATTSPSGDAEAAARTKRSRPGKRPASGASVENVRPDEVADEDRDTRADAEDSPRRLEPLRPGAPADRSVNTQLAGLAEELRRAWQAIPQYSPINAQSRLTSGFGWRRSPVDRRREFHGGIDLAAPRGTSIVAPAAAFVERVFVDGRAGLVVVLEHGNGLQTLYGHLDRVLVEPGQEVARGTPIATVGSTGSRTTGPHLHYGIKLEGKYVNPRRYLFEPSAPATAKKSGGRAS